MSTFEEILEKDGKLVYKTKGISMNPMLYQNRDLVVIGVLTGFVRDGRQYSVTDPEYQRYVKLWDAAYPVRSFNVHLKWRVKGVLRRIIKGKK